MAPKAKVFYAQRLPAEVIAEIKRQAAERGVSPAEVIAEKFAIPGKPMTATEVLVRQKIPAQIERRPCVSFRGLQGLGAEKNKKPWPPLPSEPKNGRSRAPIFKPGHKTL